MNCVQEINCWRDGVGGEVRTRSFGFRFEHQDPNFSQPIHQSSFPNQHYDYTMPPSPPQNAIQVHGLSVSPTTQCAHWNSDLDIIAIKHACCSKFYACITCHNELESHEPAVWPISKREERAVLCGKCKYVLTVDEYLHSGSCCTSCGAGFNPGCKGHWGMYFEIMGGEQDDVDSEKGGS
jgi:uncharacterized CHY-type Zn-finger protein